MVASRHRHHLKINRGIQSFYLLGIAAILFFTVSESNASATHRVYRSTQTPLEKLADDVSSLEYILHSIQLLPAIHDETVTTESSMKKLFDFGSNISLETLQQNNIDGLEEELGNITKAFEVECGVSVGCKVEGGLAEGIAAVKKLLIYEDIVGNISNLMLISELTKKVKHVEKLNSMSKLVEHLGNLKNYPKNNIEDDYFVRDISTEMGNVLLSISLCQNASVDFPKLDVEAAVKELDYVIKIKFDTLQINSEQPIIDKLSNAIDQLNEKVNAFLSLKSEFKQSADKLELIGKMISDGKTQFYQAKLTDTFRLSHLELLHGDELSNSVLKLVGLDNTVLDEILKPVEMLKVELKPWLEHRKKLNILDGFKAMSLRIAKLLMIDWEKLKHFTSIDSLKNCIEEFQLTGFVDDDVSSLQSSLRGKIDNFKRTVVQEFANLMISDSSMNDLKFFQKKTGSAAETLKAWKTSAQLDRMTTTQKNLSKVFDKFENFLIDPTKKLLPWIESTGISKGLKCAIEHDKLRTAEKIFNDVASFQMVTSSDKDAKEVLSFANSISNLLVEWKSKKTPSNIPKPSIVPKNLANVLNITNQFSQSCAALRALSAFETFEQDMNSVISGFSKIDKDIKTTLDPDEKKRLDEMWTSEAKSCLMSTMQAMKQMRNFISGKKFEKLSDLKPVFLELSKLPSCNVGLLLAELMTVVSNSELKTSLEAVQHIDLNYASAQASILDDLQNYFEKSMRFSKPSRDPKFNETGTVGTNTAESGSSFYVKGCVISFIFLVICLSVISAVLASGGCCCGVIDKRVPDKMRWKKNKNKKPNDIEESPSPPEKMKSKPQSTNVTSSQTPRSTGTVSKIESNEDVSKSKKATPLASSAPNAQQPKSATSSKSNESAAEPAKPAKKKVKTAKKAENETQSNQVHFVEIALKNPENRDFDFNQCLLPPGVQRIENPTVDNEGLRFCYGVYED